MNFIIDNILFLPIATYVAHYIYSFYSHYYKTNRNTQDMSTLLSNKVYLTRVTREIRH